MTLTPTGAKARGEGPVNSQTQVLWPPDINLAGRHRTAQHTQHRAQSLAAAMAAMAAVISESGISGINKQLHRKKRQLGNDSPHAIDGL